MSTSRPRDANVRLALLIAILIFVPLLLVLFVLELLDVVLIWVVTRTTRSIPIVWAFALMFLLLVVVLGMGTCFPDRSNRSRRVAPIRPSRNSGLPMHGAKSPERSSENAARISEGNTVSPRPGRTVPVNRVPASVGDHGDEGVQGVDSGVPTPTRRRRARERQRRAGPVGRLECGRR